MKRQIPWARTIAEGVVIVVSVLIALAADAWWDGRRDRAGESARLSAVRSELQDARLTYEGLVDVIASRTHLIAEVIRESSHYTASSARLDSVFFQLGPWSDPSPPTAAVDDALSGGGLSLIRSAEVRRSLGRYRTSVEAVRAEAQALRDRFESEVQFQYEYINLRRQMATSSSAAFPVDLPEPGFVPRYEELLQNRRFINQMVGHAALMGRMRARTDGALLAIDNLVALLDSLGFR